MDEGVKNNKNAKVEKKPSIITALNYSPSGKIIGKVY